jgi:hypothetical protein
MTREADRLKELSLAAVLRCSFHSVALKKTAASNRAAESLQ